MRQSIEECIFELFHSHLSDSGRLLCCTIVKMLKTVAVGLALFCHNFCTLKFSEGCISIRCAHIACGHVIALRLHVD